MSALFLLWKISGLELVVNYAKILAKKQEKKPVFDGGSELWQSKQQEERRRGEEGLWEGERDEKRREKRRRGKSVDGEARKRWKGEWGRCGEEDGERSVNDRDRRAECWMKLSSGADETTSCDGLWGGRDSVGSDEREEVVERVKHGQERGEE